MNIMSFTHKFILATASLLAAISLESLTAATIHIATTGSDSAGTGQATAPFATIQKGISHAQEGDTVLVAAGTYTGEGNRNIDLLGKAVIVKSVAGPKSVTLDLQQNRAFLASSSESLATVIDGFTIIGGYAVTGQDWGGIGIIDINGNAALTLKNCIFSNNTVEITYFTARANIVRANSHAGSVIENCLFYDNTCHGGYWVNRSFSSIVCGKYSILRHLTIANNKLSSNYWWNWSDGGLPLYLYDVSGGQTIGANSVIVRNNGNRDSYCMMSETDPTFSITDGGVVNNAITALTSGFEQVDPLFVDPENGNFSLSPGSPAIDAGDPSVVDPDGTRSDIGFKLARAIESDNSTDSSYRLMGLKTGSNQIVQMDAATGETSLLFTLPFTVSTSDGFDYNPADGFLYICHPEGNGIVGFYKLNLATKTTTLVKQLTPNGDGSIESLGFTSEGNAYCYDERSAFSKGTMNYVTWSTSTIQTRGSTNTPSVLGGDYDTVRNVFWATDEWNGKVYQVNPTNSTVIWTSTSSFYPGNGAGNLLDMDVAPNGDVLVAGTDNGLFKIMRLDPETGNLSQWLTLPDPIDYRIASVPTHSVVLSFAAPTHGTISGAGPYDTGAAATLTATANPGYLFSGWTGDASGTDNPLSLTMYSNKSVGATFGPDLGDSDNDGLTNYAEVVTHFTNPNSSDSDEDGYSDGEEVERGSDPSDSASIPESELSVFSFGSNEEGNMNVPPGLAHIISVDGTRHGSIALLANGSIVQWGNWFQSPPPNLPEVVEVDAGWYWALVRLSDGSLRGWGANEVGQVSGIPSGNDFVEIATGNMHGVALRANGTVVSWGRNDMGQSSPPQGLNDVVSISAHGHNCLSLKSNGTVVAWGTAAWGINNVPAGLSDVKAIACGDTFALALKTDGTVVAWGNNADGQTNVPQGLKNVAKVFAEGNTAYAILENGSSVAWGYRSNEALQIPTLPSGYRWVAIRGGWEHMHGLAELAATFRMAVSPSINGSITGQGNYDLGATATITATPNPGYRFAGWTGAASGTTNPLTITMDADKVVGAAFDPDYSDSDNDGLTNYAEIVTHFTNPNSSDSDGDGYSDVEEIEWESDAKSSWSKPQVYLSISSNGNGRIDATGLDYWLGWYGSYGEATRLRSTVTLTAVPDSGFFFSGWTGAIGTTNPLLLTMDANKSVQANFEPDYADSDGDGLTNYAEAVIHYTNPNSSDSDGDGYSDGEEVERGTSPNSSWDKPRVLLSYSSNGGGNIDATGLDDGYGWGYYMYYYYEGYAPLRSIVTLTPVAYNGYVFTGWFGDASGTSSPLNLQMDSSKSVQANFEPDYADTDGDGLTNYEELAIYYTNPNASDTDSDGHSDAKEIQRGSDPNNSASIPEKLGNYIGSFDSISNKVYGGSSFLINLPAASSGLPVVVSVKSGPAKVEGNRVRLTGAGIVVLAANQPGDEDYKAANEVTVSFAVLDLKNMTGEYIGNFNSEYFEGAQEAMNRNGQLSMKLAKGGAFTGSMVILGSKISIRGKFDDYGTAEISVSSKSISGVFVDLSIEPMTETEFQVGAGIRWSDETSSEFVCYPVAYTGTGGTNNCTLAGRQINSLLINQMVSGIDFGHCYAKIKVSTNGTLTFAGRMADGSTVSGTSRLVKDEYGDLLAQASFPLPAVKGLLHGVALVQTDPEEGQYHLASPYEWTWVRLPQSRARVFKEGFAERLNVYGQVWNYTKGQSALPEGVDGFTFQVDPDAIVLEELLNLWGSWPSSNKPTWDYMPKGFSFKVNPITGDISGTAPRSINGKATKAATYQGLLLRPGLETYDGSPLIGGGYILGTESSGVIELTVP